MAVLNATDARKDFYKILDTALSDEPVTITTKSGNVVVISEEELDRLNETLYLMSDPNFIRDVKKCHSASDSEFEAWN